MKRWVLGVQYDGQGWQGWQTQPSGRTVQDALERALAQFCNRHISTTCAGRTDAGVHALEQIVHFDTDLERAAYSWVNGVNAHLPAGVAIRWAHPLDVSELDGAPFHARFSARKRTYHYLIHNAPVRSPLLRGRVGWVFRPLDAARMQQAAQALLGEHDFSAFRAAECQSLSPVRTMHAIDVWRQGELVVVRLCANAFLHHMVRNIVGSLIYVGTGKRAPDWIGTLLHTRQRHLAAPTFAPEGLYLSRVEYDAAWGVPVHAAETMLGW